MKQQLGFYEVFSTLVTTAILFFVLALSACSSRQSPSPVISTASTQLTTAPVSSSVTTSNGNLFDTTTTQDAVPSVTPTPVATSTAPNFDYYNSQVPASQAQCLGTNSGNLFGTNLPISCYSNQTNSLSTNNLFDLGSQSYGQMGYCLQFVQSQGGQYCDSQNASTVVDSKVGQIFQASQMALVRCFRQIMRHQIMAAQWMPEQQQSFQQNDSMLYLILTLFSRQNK